MQVAKSPPDGYTILQNTNGAAIGPRSTTACRSTRCKDFIPVTQLVALDRPRGQPQIPGNTSVKELIAHAKAKPGQAQLRHRPASATRCI